MTYFRTLLILLATTACCADVPSFEADVSRILKNRCVMCHSGDDAKNGLDLSTRKGMLTGGKTGSAMQPSSLRESLLWTFIATDKMPASDEKLTADEKDTLRRWILAGAPETKADAEKAAARLAQPKSVHREPLGEKAMAEAINRLIAARLKKESVTASRPADDAEFLRRVYLDLNGRVPSYDETVSFLATKDADRRAALIDQRLRSPEFGSHMAILWHRLLIPKSAGAYGRIPHRKFREWLASQFNENRPWNAIVTDLLTAEGYLPSNKDTENNRKKDAKLQPQNVATAFLNVHNTEGRPQPSGIIASVSRLFLAQSIECAQCHNHPMAKWQQTDFWAAAAFFERVRYEKAVYGDTSIARLVEPTEGKDLIYEDKAKARYSFVPGVYPEPVIALLDANGKSTGAMIRAKYLDGPEAELDVSKSFRTPFAEWATSKDNPYFARAMVNRIWSQLLGRGFVEPVDDMSEDNLPSHPELLGELAAEFSGSGFAVKHLVRCICLSETYQRASQPAKDEPAEASLFAQQSLKQMTGEQLLASLEVALPTFRATLEEDAKDKNPYLFRKAFLEIYETGDGLATEHTRGLQQALRMMNGDGKLFNREAVDISNGRSVEDNVRRIYLQALNRNPTDSELKQMSEFVEVAKKEIAAIDKKRLPQRRRDQPDNTPDPYADVLWVLINSGEFIFNH